MKETVKVSLSDGSKIDFTIFAESNKKHSLQLIDESEAADFGEAPLQLLEGFGYEYVVSGEYKLKEIPKVVNSSRVNESTGRITPNIYVGTLMLDVLDKTTSELKGTFPLEVRSVKTTYRQDYRFMLEDITERCTDLLMQHSSPVTQNYTINFNNNPQTLYQRFAFVNSVIGSSDFKEAVHRIVSFPVTLWAEKEEVRDIRRARRMGNAIIKQFASGPDRIKVPEQHRLQNRFASIPAQLTVKSKHETVDTPENRFIKHALTTFSQFCADIRSHLKPGDRAFREAVLLEEVLENLLSHSFFKDISPPSSLALNSPVLQRKEGYREVLRVWLMFDLAAKLVWSGGEDVYSAGKRDVAVLYEYWLFFTLLDLFKELFHINSAAIGALIEPTSDGLGLKLKSGKYIPLEGVYETGSRKLNIRFSFNRTFTGEHKYPSGGSWTKDMRPDYTLSIWPIGITASEAEEQELIVHIHFDAKYKISDLNEILGEEDEDLEEEKREQKKGNYKRADLFKMHAYRDAIRRTGGAYILYPGSQSYNRTGFHELIPGLGAFPIKPSRTDNGIPELKEFIHEIINHFLDRSSQRERASYHIYDIHRNQNDDILHEPLPEFYGQDRALPPDETNVLIGYYKDATHLEWIKKEGLYNARMDSNRGSLQLGPAEAGARYLLLHTKGQLVSGEIWRIKGKGPRVFSKQKMTARNYINQTQDFYLVYEVEKVGSAEFVNAEWDIRKLEEHKSGRGSALPFAVSLTELMQAKV